MAIGIIANDEKNKLISSKNENKYYEPNYNQIDVNNTNESKSIICANIENNSKVLDVGCSQGVIGYFLKNNKNCDVYGIEIDLKALNYAKKTCCYKALYNFDISVTDNPSYQNFFEKYEKKFDYIIFSDVLEHLAFPANVLYNFGNLLKDNGKILISIPNIAHYDVIDGLLNEKFNYSDMGILDNTHLRFFTKKSFAEYIESANNAFNINFDLEWIGKTVIKPKFYGNNKNLDNCIEENENLFILQNIFCCTKVKLNEEKENLKELLHEERPDISKIIDSKMDLENKLIKENEILAEENYNLKLKIEDLLYTQNDLSEYASELECRVNGLLNSRSIRYTKFIRYFKNKRFKKKAKTNCQDYKQSILFFIHSWIDIHNNHNTSIGGTTLHLLNLIDAIKSKINCYVITVINNKYVLVKIEQNNQKIYDLNLKVKTKYFDKYDYAFMEKMLELIDQLKIDLVHIHHFMNFPCDLQFLPKKIKTIVTLHDFFAICPNIHLINYKGEICLDGEKLDCSKCMKYSKIDFDTRNIAVRNLLLNAEMVIAPDESVFKQVEYNIKLPRKKVIQHGINIEKYNLDKLKEKDYSNTNTEVKNIAFLGIISLYKGLNIIKDLVANNNDKNIVYHLFGSSVDPYLNENHNNYVFHGFYKQQDICRLLIENKIDLVILPSICSETFSYTLSETILAKVPVLSFNLGALANRIKKDNLGWVIDKKSNFDYKDILKKYKTIFDKKNYQEVLDSLEKHQTKSIEGMIEDIKSCYEQNSYKLNDYDKINEYLEKYHLRYIV